MSALQHRVGIYAWGGPGTIRLLQTKYPSPNINEESFLHLYDQEYLSQAKELFGVTDAWVTYSWGFSSKKEHEDYSFLRHHLPIFKQLGIKTHAYVQGLNVVTSDFKDQDLFCRDGWGKMVPYSRGRSFICPNNPAARSLLRDRVELASEEDCDGVFVDNILFGLPPFTVHSDILPFFGCSCTHCQTAFEATFGYPLPTKEKRQNQIADYLQFREDSLTQLIQELSAIVVKKKKEFGINLYDPYLRNDVLYYGYRLAAIEPYLDYFLIENHSLPSQPKNNNSHLLPLLSSTQKPVFVVSYKNGIGFEPQYSQNDLNSIASESQRLGYNPCYKVTEFTTKGKWHALDCSQLKPVVRLDQQQTIKVSSPRVLQRSRKRHRALIHLVQRHVSLTSTLIHEKKWLWAFVSKTGIYKNQLRKSRMYHL